MPRFVMISRGEIVAPPTAAASAFATVAASLGLTLPCVDQVMTASEIKPTAASAAMILIIARPPEFSEFRSRYCALGAAHANSSNSSVFDVRDTPALMLRAYWRHEQRIVATRANRTDVS